MLRLSQQAVSDVAQSFTHAGITNVRDMNSLQEVLLLTRTRVRDSTAGDDFDSQRTGLIRAIQPLVQWLLSQSDVVELPLSVQCELVWNIYTAAMSRTNGADAFSLITASEEAWNEAVSQALGQGGHASLGSLGDNRNEQNSVFREMFPWFAVLFSVGCFAVEQFMESGRGRFYLVLMGAAALVAAFFGWYWRYTTAPTSMVSHSTGGTFKAFPTFREPFEQRPPSTEINNDVSGTRHIPPLAPTLPGNEHFSSAVQPAPSGATMAVGDVVGFTADGEAKALHGQKGTISEVHGNGFMVKLHSGLRVGPVGTSSLTMDRVSESGSAETLQPREQVATTDVYAPFSLGGSEARVQAQATRLKSALEKSSALQSTIPTWGQLFWQAVKNESDLYGLEAAIKTTLISHGYIGPNTLSPPRTDELKKQLAQLETLGGPPHGTGGSTLRVMDGEMVTDPEQMAWHLKLPADLQRAGPEIYRNIRSEGVSSVRQWVNEQHPSLEQKNTPQYQDLFMTATIVDFELAECRSEGMLMAKLATSDALEIHLRRLGAFIYLRRTRDKTGANRILGIRAPGSNTDIAPKWLLDDANLHSKTEFQRQERGAKASKYEGHGGGEVRQRKGDGGGRGKKGGGRGKKGGGASSSTQGWEQMIWIVSTGPDSLFATVDGAAGVD